MICAHQVLTWPRAESICLPVLRTQSKGEYYRRVPNARIHHVKPAAKTGTGVAEKNICFLRANPRHGRGSIAGDAYTFMQCVKQGTVDSVRSMLVRGADPDNWEKLEEYSGAPLGPPLWQALVAGQWEVAELLVQFGANVNIAGTWHRYASPLTLALEAKKWSLARMMLSNKAGLDQNYPSSQRALLASAMEDGQWDIVNMLVDTGGDAKALHLAIQANDFSIVESLLRYDGSRRGGPQNAEYLLLKERPKYLELSNEKPPLVAAAELGHIEVAETLIKHGRDWIPGDDQNEALRVAGEKGFISLVRFMKLDVTPRVNPEESMEGPEGPFWRALQS